MKSETRKSASHITRLKIMNLIFMLVIFIMLGFAFDWHRSHKQLALVSLDLQYQRELAGTQSLVEHMLATQEQKLDGLTGDNSREEVAALSQQFDIEVEATLLQKFLINSKARDLAEAHIPDNDRLLDLIDRTTQQIQDTEKASNHILSHIRTMIYRELHFRHFASKERKDWVLLPIGFGYFYSKSLSKDRARTKYASAEKQLATGDTVSAMITFREIAISRAHHQPHMALKVKSLLKCLAYEKTLPPGTKHVESPPTPENPKTPKTPETSETPEKQVAQQSPEKPAVLGALADPKYPLTLDGIKNKATVKRSENKKRQRSINLRSKRNTPVYRCMNPEVILSHFVYLFHARLSANPSADDIPELEAQLLSIAPEYSTLKEKRLPEIKRNDKIHQLIQNQALPQRLYLGDNLFFHASKHNIGVLYHMELSQLIPAGSHVRFFESKIIDPTDHTDPANTANSPLPGNAYHTKLGTYRGLSLYIPNDITLLARQSIEYRYQMVNSIIIGLAIMNVCGFLILLHLLKREHELHGLRTRFLSTVSHELKTPLSLIKLYAESLIHGRVQDAKRLAYLDTILIETDRLNGIVSNIVDFSSVEQDQLKLNLANVSLSDTCKGTLEGFKKRFETENFEVVSQIDDDITLKTDRLVFTQILFNLIDNAMKYSGSSRSIKILLREVTDQVVLSVCDHGIGVPDKEKPHIFRDFYRVDDSNVQAKRGSGIGLYLVKQFVNQMNGTVSVKDNDPAGSIFEVRLPAT